MYWKGFSSDKVIKLSKINLLCHIHYLLNKIELRLGVWKKSGEKIKDF